MNEDKKNFCIIAFYCPHRSLVHLNSHCLFSRFSSVQMPWRKFFNQQSRAVRHKFPGKSININASMFYNFSK